MNTSDILNKAADLIEQRGWISGDGWIEYDGQPESKALCLEGGIQAASGLAGMHREGEAALLACPAFVAVKEYLGQRPYHWNDEQGRTAPEVVEVLRACAVIEASRERETAAVS